MFVKWKRVFVERRFEIRFDRIPDCLQTNFKEIIM